jgi:hypothetical protein
MRQQGPVDLEILAPSFHALTSRAEVRSATTEAGLLDSLAARTTRKPGAPEDPEVGQEISLSHEAISVEAERRPAVRDGGPEDSPDRSMEPAGAGLRHSGLARVDPSRVKHLVCVDIYESGDHPLAK